MCFIETTQSTINAPRTTGVTKEETYELSIEELCQVQAIHVAPSKRTQLMYALRCALQKQAKPLTDDQTMRLVSLSKHLCDWQFQLKLQEKETLQLLPQEAITPYIQLGDFQTALEEADKQLALSPGNPVLIELKQFLQVRLLEHCFTDASLRSEELMITPLDYNHVSDFIWQFTDPKIAELCTLPNFVSAEHWINWLHECKQDKRRYLFAVIHRDMGFIGSVCLQIHNGLGFFYYWLGTDFQGKGYGPKAVALLLDFGYKKLDMQSCFTKIFNHNLASHKAIAKLHFRQLPFSAVAPSENEVFYYHGKEHCEHLLHKQLAWLLTDLRSGISLTPIENRTKS